MIDTKLGQSLRFVLRIERTISISLAKMSYRRRSKNEYVFSRRSSGKPGLMRVVQKAPSSSLYIAQWDVESHTTPGKHYTVSLKHDHTWQCSCPQWKFRRKECKHIIEAKTGHLTTARQIGETVLVGRTSDGRALFKSEESNTPFFVDKDGDQQTVLF